PGDIPPGTVCVRSGGRLLFRSGAGHVPRVIHLHALPHSRSLFRALAHALVLLVLSFVFGRATLAVCVLGLRSDLRAECTDERPDRADLSRRGNWNFSAAETKLTASAPNASGFQLCHLSGHRRTLARPRGAAQSCTGSGPWLPVVLLH